MAINDDLVDARVRLYAVEQRVKELEAALSQPDEVAPAVTPEPRAWRGVRWIDTINASNLAEEIALHFAHDCEDSMCGEDADESNCERAWIEDKLNEFLYSSGARVPARLASAAPAPRLTEDEVRQCFTYNDPCHNDFNSYTTLKKLMALLAPRTAKPASDKPEAKGGGK